ncbi:TnsA endonuclease N-terminal domain-containing protein [Bacillus sp. WLY-B-L8]|uniref:TnsA endonuclease N-terminal domain-containing protein n=1 Tax=Bacillus multifaciens TaxID=3068506 RepID=UPI0027410A80|nr:TnsA endonuclease N-terminal domain-containing protein [Bacillus sp. WLY-B-L8]MDP7979709.1 TnsA endonuclease N-terminal domain-containing protein [Bacillus sp. WLY-B-L8]
MLGERGFEEWSNSLNLKPEGIELIRRVRDSSPVRSVQSKKNNVAGRYSSTKMGMTIQFESHTVELAAIYLMEFNSGVLEYYDQPCTLKVSYINQNEKKVSYLYTPDFLVLYKENVMIEEWKTEEQLEKLSQKEPNRYFRSENGEWRCPSYEEAANQYGLQFKIRTPRDINSILYRNLMFLEDYLIENSCSINQESIQEIWDIVSNQFGITLSNLIQSIKVAKVDDVYRLIARKKLYIDLEKEVLTNLDNVRIFQSKQHYEAYKGIEVLPLCEEKQVNILEISINEVLLWNGIEWKILNNGVDTVSLLSTDGDIVELPRLHLIELFNQSKIKSKNIQVTSTVNEEFLNPILEASPEDLEKANQRLEIVQKALQKEKFQDIGVTDRTVRTWLKNYRDAEELFGNGYVGLLPNYKKKGNRNRKLPSETIELMEKFIETEYENIKQKNKYTVYGQFLGICEKESLLAPSYKTFCVAINNRPKYEQVKKRQGNRAAYEYEEFYWNLSSEVPRHGERPFQISHIDHTELDIELRCSTTNRILGRPYITFLVDAYSRKNLSFHISFDPPSYKAAMMVLRKCVYKHGRLPKNIVVDGGKEFHSIYFDTLLAYNKLHKKVRPPAKARFGNIIERLFGTTNTSLIHNLQGNTKIMKNTRQVTKSVNPKQHAIWTLGRLNEVLNEWIEEIYHHNIHPSLDGQSPQEAFELGIKKAGNRESTYIKYDDEFVIMTLPSTRNGKVTINSRTGIRVNYINYWNYAFKSPQLEGESVAIRYDPYDISVVYAYVKGKWIKCTSELYYDLKGKTEKELRIATEEIKKKKSLHSGGYTINARKIAAFISKLEKEEKMMVQNLKDTELKKIVDLPLESNISNSKNNTENDNYEEDLEKERKSFKPFKQFNIYHRGD